MSVPRSERKKRRTLQQRLLGTSCLLIILPLLVTSVFLYLTARRMVLQNATALLESSMNQAGRLLHNELGIAYNTVSAVSEHLEIQNIQLRGLREDYSKKEQLEDFQYLESFFMLLRQNPSIHSVRMTVQDGLLYSHNSMFLDLSGETAKPYLPFLEKTYAGLPTAFLKSNADSSIFGQAPTEVVSCIKPIRSIENYQTAVGLAIVDVKTVGFADILRETRAAEDTTCMITDGEGRVVASLGEEAELAVLLEDAGSGTEPSQTVRASGQYLLASRRDDTYGWSLHYLRPMEPLVRDYTRYLVWIAGLLLLLSALTLLLGSGLYRSLITRMKNIVLCLRQVETGNLDSPLTVKCDDEIGEIEESYNYMIAQLKDLLTQRERLSQKIAAAEMDALMARIDPHFLYNTLNTLSWAALDYQAVSINRMLMALSDYYKTCLQNSRPESPVRDEIRHAELYVQIHNMRYENAIALQVDAPPDTLDLMMPNMVLQPLIENSILHGILEKPEKQGAVTLRVRRTASSLDFLIADDGMGMDVETLRLLSDPSGKAGGSYGIYNINERLKLKYGGGFSLRFQSTVGAGTRVTLSIPAPPPDPEGPAELPET